MKCTSYLDVFDVENDLESIDYSIIDLLPQSHLALVRDTKMFFEILRISYSSIALLIDCLSKFYIDKQYKYFDPHVGENACQIRAYMFINFSKETPNKDSLLDRVSFLKCKRDKIKALMNSKITYKNNSHTIQEMMKKHNFYFSMTWHEIFLCKSYVLTIFKKSYSKDTYVCSEDIAIFFSISKKVSKKMVHKYQLHLSMISCKFIQKIAKDLDFDKYNIPTILSSVLYDDDGRMVYPCFFYSMIVFFHMINSRCTTLVILDCIHRHQITKEFIIFEGGSEQGRIVTSADSKDFVNRTCVVITGQCIQVEQFKPLELLKNLNYFGLSNILLMNMAAHPQFSGAKLTALADQLISTDARLSSKEKDVHKYFLEKKENAKKYGFCRENQSLLLVKHVFVDILNTHSFLNKNNKESVSEMVSLDT